MLPKHQQMIYYMITFSVKVAKTRKAFTNEKNRQRFQVQLEFRQEDSNPYSISNAWRKGVLKPN